MISDLRCLNWDIMMDFSFQSVDETLSESLSLVRCTKNGSTQISSHLWKFSHIYLSASVSCSPILYKLVDFCIFFLAIQCLLNYIATWITYWKHCKVMVLPLLWLSSHFLCFPIFFLDQSHVFHKMQNTFICAVLGLLFYAPLFLLLGLDCVLWPLLC